MTQRLVKHPYLAIFDGPDTNVSTEARPRSTVPLQALYLMNNPFVQEQAAGLRPPLDRRLVRSDAPDRAGLPTGLVAGHRHPMNAIAPASSCRMCCSCPRRPPARPRRSREREAWTSLAKVMLTANEFLYID